MRDAWELTGARVRPHDEPDTHSICKPGALAQQMEEQLMQEFEALLASRRKEQPSLLGAKPSSSSSSLSRKVRRRKEGNRPLGVRPPKTMPTRPQIFLQADGQQQLQQEARDAVYWRSMYERLRDVRETEAERVSASCVMCLCAFFMCECFLSLCVCAFVTMRVAPLKRRRRLD